MSLIHKLFGAVSNRNGVPFVWNKNAYLFAQGLCIQSPDSRNQGKRWKPEHRHWFLHHTGESHLLGYTGETPVFWIKWLFLFLFTVFFTSLSECNQVMNCVNWNVSVFCVSANAQPVCSRPPHQQWSEVASRVQPSSYICWDAGQWLACRWRQNLLWSQAHLPLRTNTFSSAIHCLKKVYWSFYVFHRCTLTCDHSLYVYQQSLQIAAFLFTVCHVVIVVQDWFTDLNLYR